MLKIRMPLTKTASKLKMQKLAADSSRAVVRERTRKTARLTAMQRKRMRRAWRMIRLKRIMKMVISTFFFKNATAKNK